MDENNKDDGLVVNDCKVNERPPLRYKIKDTTKCDPFNYACDMTCENRTLCLFNPSSICYNATMEDYKKFIHNMGEFQEYYLHELNTNKEFKKCIDELMKNKDKGRD